MSSQTLTSSTTLQPRDSITKSQRFQFWRTQLSCAYVTYYIGVLWGDFSGNIHSVSWQLTPQLHFFTLLSLGRRRRYGTVSLFTHILAGFSDQESMKGFRHKIMLRPSVNRSGCMFNVSSNLIVRRCKNGRTPWVYTHERFDVNVVTQCGSALSTVFIIIVKEAI